MISYDDLVAALATWRARQGLPVVQMLGSIPERAAAPATPSAHTGPQAAARPLPPSAPPRASAPRPAVHAQLDFDDGALVEDAAYDAVVDDYVVALAVEGESTAIGGAPDPVTEGVLVPKRGMRAPDR